MDRNFFSFIIIPAIVLITSIVVRYIRNKIYKPKVENEVQTPGGLERFIRYLMIFLTGFSGLFAVIGLLAGEMEMAMVFGGMGLLFLVVTIILKRAHNTSYQENEEYFTIQIGDEEHQVYYENIVDWQPSFNEIKILNKTKADQEYIPVNI